MLKAVEWGWLLGRNEALQAPEEMAITENLNTEYRILYSIVIVIDYTMGIRW